MPLAGDITDAIEGRLFRMKNLFKFLGCSSVILVGMLGAYIVFHMWNLTETGRKKANTAHIAAPNQVPRR